MLLMNTANRSLYLNQTALNILSQMKNQRKFTRFNKQQKTKVKSLRIRIMKRLENMNNSQTSRKRIGDKL